MFEFKEKYGVEDLRLIMKELRSDHGCPWDREQDHKSIRMDVLEEAYEVAEAIDSENAELLKEELGDLMLQVVFHSEIESEKGVFDLDDVADGICKKLIYRHPHVFGDLQVDTSAEVLKNWDALKSKSKNEEKASDRLKSVPKLLPALMRGEKVGKRAANVGFDFGNVNEVIERLKSEITELEEALNSESDIKIEEELGDILFSCTNLSRFLKKDSEKALTFAINKFIIRFSSVEALIEEDGKTFSELSQEELDEYWEKAKKNTVI
ncbi:MAG: nucleoside triphosphate pyrophosphohydrolase [Ruminiclostridium sp.]|nr:nucleoside triphosphate pyrophosphohydrolase [Ruminiclostridium sp.]MBQ8841829.1 nucleoside triphosphate pyrophosphohydrolase [Ruminiclostridium sp.]